MISSVAITFAVGVFVFIALISIISKERKNNRRFFASRFRGWLDKLVDKTGNWLMKSWDHFVRYIIQLHWYYSIHSILKTILKTLVAFYTYIENIFERNRKRTKELRSEKHKLSEDNHLQKVAQHRVDTELTPSQKNKLRKKKLEGKH